MGPTPSILHCTRSAHVSFFSILPYLTRTLNEPSWLWVVRGEKKFYVHLFSKWAKLKPNLNSTIKQIELEHTNVLVNKLVSVRLDLSKYNIICLHIKIYLYNTKTGLWMFVNKLILFINSINSQFYIKNYILLVFRPLKTQLD